MKFPTPTRAGDWRVINGQLVDVTGLDLVAESAGPAAVADPKPPAPRPTRRARKSKSRS